MYHPPELGPHLGYLSVGPAHPLQSPLPRLDPVTHLRQFSLHLPVLVGHRPFFILSSVPRSLELRQHCLAVRDLIAHSLELAVVLGPLGQVLRSQLISVRNEVGDQVFSLLRWPPPKAASQTSRTSANRHLRCITQCNIGHPTFITDSISFSRRSSYGTQQAHSKQSVTGSY